MPSVNPNAPPFASDGVPGAPPAAGASPPPGAGPTPEAVWSYRGYNLRASEFTTAMVHYYRAEIQRGNMAAAIKLAGVTLGLAAIVVAAIVT